MFDKLAMMGALAGAALIAAPPAPFQQVRSEARQIRSTAMGMEKLASQPNATWSQYDTQWNEIKPVEEALVMHLGRLELKEESLSAADQKVVDDVKPAIQDIAARTHQLRVLLDQPGVDLKSPKLNRCARDLARDAAHLAQMTAHT
jgi:hypothetical protein